MSSSAWKWGTGSWAVLRLVTLLAAWASSVWMEPGSTISVPGYDPPELTGLADVIAGSWLRADALWYLSIAENGYESAGSFAFFPLFPLLVRAVSPAFAGQELFAALVVANLACLLGFVFLYSFFDRLEGGLSAKTATVALGVFPTSFFLVAPYAEPLLIACGAACMLFASRDRFGWAGVAGALAALTRPFGIFLIIPLFAFGKGKWPRSWKAVAGPIAGLTVWIAWVAIKTGHFLGPLQAQSLWQREFAFPLSTFGRAVGAWMQWRATEVGQYMLIDIAAAVLGIAMVILGLLRSRQVGTTWRTALSLAAYSSGVLLVAAANPFPPRPFLSLPRFLLAAFPSFSGIALAPAAIRILLGAASVVGLFVLTAAYVAARPIF